MVAWLAYKSKRKDSVSLFSFGHKFGSVWTTRPTRALDASKKTQKNKKTKKTLFVSFLMLSLASPSYFFLLCSTSCTGRNFKVHPLQNLSYTIERFIQMSVILLQVLSQHDPVAPQIGSESAVNFSVP